MSQILTRTRFVVAVLAVTVLLPATALVRSHSRLATSNVDAGSGQEIAFNHPQNHSALSLQAHPDKHRLPAIDGAISPTAFSDELALRLLMRMAAHPDDRAGRNYIRVIFDPGSGHPRVSDEEAEAIRGVSVEFSSRVTELFASGLPHIRPELTTMTPAYRARLAKLLGPGGDARLANVLNTRIKPKIRKFTKPNMAN